MDLERPLVNFWYLTAIEVKQETPLPVDLAANMAGNVAACLCSHNKLTV